MLQRCEDKTARSVDDAMKLSVMKEDLEDTQESLDTIRILNDYDALELFKKTLPAPAFTQIHKLSNEIVNSSVTTSKSAGVKTLGTWRQQRHVDERHRSGLSFPLTMPWQRP